MESVQPPELGAVAAAWQEANMSDDTRSSDLASGAPTNVQSTSQTVVTAASDTFLSTDGLIVELKVDGAGSFVSPRTLATCSAP